MEMFRAERFSDGEIKPYNVLKITDKTVTYENTYQDYLSKKIKIDKRRENIESGYHKWCETYLEAELWLLARQSYDVKCAEERLAEEQETLSKLRKKFGKGQ